MHLQVFNLTEGTLTFRPKHGAPLTVQANTSVTVPKATHSFALAQWTAAVDSSSTVDLIADEKTLLLHDGVLGKQFMLSLRRRVGPSSQSQLLQAPEDCPWRIYRSRKSKRRQSVLIFPKRNLATFLSQLPDDLSMTDVCLPGTHDTMAFYGWPVSQCQSASTPLPVQFANGIRVLDIRLAVKHGRLIAYHGTYPQRATFQSILTDLHNFLSAPETCRETIIVSIKQEDYDKHGTRLFSQKVRDEVEEGPGGMGMWFWDNRIPYLGEIRGKAVMFSRFGGDGAEWGGLERMGIHPTNWPDSEKTGFTWQCKDTLVRTQDWYHIPSFLSIPEKSSLSTELLLPGPPNAYERTLSITYFSASSFPFATPTVVSTGWGWPSWGLGVEGVNSRASHFLLSALSQSVTSAEDREKGAQADNPLRAWTFMDFFMQPVGAGVVPLLVECNFRG